MSAEHPVSPPRSALVTRPQPQADAWVQRLQALGRPAVALPLLQTSPNPDTAALAAARADLPGCALAMFVSPNAVAHWAAQAPAGWRWPAGVLAGAPGPGTRAALLAAGVPAAAIVSPPEGPGRFDSEALWDELRERRPWAGSRVQVLRGNGGRDWFSQTLRQVGAQVHLVPVYRRTPPVLGPAEQAVLVQALAQPQAHVWLFSSSEAVRHLPALAPGADWSAACALATHERIAEAAQALGCGRVLLVPPLAEAVAQAIAGLDPASPAAR